MALSDETRAFHMEDAPASPADAPTAPVGRSGDSLPGGRAQWQRPMVQRLHTYLAESGGDFGDDGDGFS
jgi:hypothetical protein